MLIVRLLGLVPIIFALLFSLASAQEVPAWRLDAPPHATALRNFRVDAAYESIGSSQPTPESLATLRAALVPYGASEAKIYVVDLRQESHGFLNGIPVSWHGEKNAANAGLGAQAVQQDEQKRLAATVGTQITAVPMGKHDTSLGLAPFDEVVASAQTERSVAEAAGFSYVRIAAQDMVAPSPRAVDEFVAFYRTLPKDAWLYLHCHAGHGRTTTFLALTALLKDPSLTADEVITREKDLGGADLSTGERCTLLKNFEEYARETRDSGFALPYSSWLEHQQPPV